MLPGGRPPPPAAPALPVRAPWCWRACGACCCLLLLPVACCPVPGCCCYWQRTRQQIDATPQVQ